MARKAGPLDVGKRERQLVEAVYRLGEAAVADVLGEIPNPPSYSAVRAMLGKLVAKGVLKFRRDGKRFLYRPAMPREAASRSALKNLVSTFFAGSATQAMAALLDASASRLTDDDLSEMRRLIEQAQRENR